MTLVEDTDSRPDYMADWLGQDQQQLAKPKQKPEQHQQQRPIGTISFAPTAKSSYDQDKQDLEMVGAKIAPTRKRYFILVMFVTLHMIKSFQWICLASVTNLVARFYRVDNLAINWSTILFMVTFLVLALPVGWFMERIGLRRAVLLGALGVTSGVTIKCFSCHHDGFLCFMLGHLIVGLTEPFFFSSYSQLASVWFPDNQVAMATAWSVVGEEIGLALGFIIPPVMVGSDPDDDATIQLGLWRLFMGIAVVSAMNTLSIVVFFDEKPRFAPGVARFKQIQQEERRRRSSSQALCEHWERKLAATAAATSATPTTPGCQQERRRSESPRALALRARELRHSVSQQMVMSRDMVADRHFLLLLAGFGLNMGTVYSIHTLLNQMITRSAPLISADCEHINSALAVSLAGATPNETFISSVRAVQPTTWSAYTCDQVNLVVGNTGLISIVAGLVGSALCGYLLDRWHRYRLTIGAAYLLTLLSMLAFTLCLRLGSSLALYLAAVPLGFAFTGYASGAFDYAVELTYPHPELLSSTLLNVSAQICGIPISLLGSLIVDTYGGETLGVFFSALLALGLLITCLQRGQLKRQHAVSSSTQLSSRSGLTPESKQSNNNKSSA